MNCPVYITRDFRPEDYDGVTQLWNETGLGGSFRGDTPQVVGQTLSRGGKLIIAESVGDKQILGTSWLTVDGRRAYLHHFGVREEFRGCGIAKTLLTESLIYSREKGLQVKLEVHSNNKAAINLYQKYGFQYLGDYKVFIIRKYSDQF
jgi:[ribosomal protein S18]-alanine N-acetyltransferase